HRGRWLSGPLSCSPQPPATQALPDTLPVPQPRRQRRRPPRKRQPPTIATKNIRQGHGSAGTLEGSLGIFRGLLVDHLQHRLGGADDQVLGVLETQVGEAADLLDDLDLLVASGLEDDVELVLLLLNSGLAATAAGGSSGNHRSRSSSGDVELLLEQLDELG